MRQVCCVLFWGACAFCGGIFGGQWAVNPGLDARAQDPPPPPPAAPLTGANGKGTVDLSEQFQSVVRKVAPTVVSVEATKSPAQPGLRNLEESGSGVLIRLEGIAGTLVVTNNHVISSARAEQITVHLADGRVFRPTKVWADPESDVAVLQLDHDSLPVATIGDSDLMDVGEWVLAFGSPFGLNRTVTHGIISAQDRGRISLGDTIRIKNFLQTDAAINPGSSGGPLVNLNGEVVGINTAIASQSGSHSGVAFAIPVNLVQPIVRQLVTNGKVQRAFLGVQLAAALEPDEALKLGLERVSGALVEIVYPNTPAAEAGLRVNDVILQVDGNQIRDENQLINMISSMKVGQRVRLQIWRNRSIELKEVIVGDWTRAKQELQR